MSIKSGIPPLYIIWLIVSAVSLVLFMYYFGGIISIVSAVSVSAIGYFLFINKACLFTLESQQIKIRYLFPMKESIKINLNDVAKISFELSYFYLTEEDANLKIFYMLHPYDTMIVDFKNGYNRKIVYFNSSFFPTIKIYRYLKNKYK